MYLNNKNPEKYWGLDIEADSLTPTVIHCVCVQNLVTDEALTFYNKEEFHEWLNGNPNITFIGHNILSFDIPALNKLWEVPTKVLDYCVDTLVLGYLYNPALDGGHSLAAWGERFKYPKIDFHEFDKLTPEMVEYCKQDVRLTLKVYKALTKKMREIGFSEQSCDIEHKIRIVINEQEKNGFWFDEVGGRKLYQQLRGRQSDLTGEIQKLFPPISKLAKRCTFTRTKTGSYPSRIEKARAKYSRVEVNDNDGRDWEGTYDCYEEIEFNIGSPKQRVERLLELGWKPQKFTEKGFPKVDEDALVAFAEESGRKEVGAIAEWLVLQGRASMLETWFNNLGKDSRIHGRINSCGATTRRMTHSNPNTANIPSGAKAKYGKECRALWGVEPGRGLVLIGYDAAGLETAGLCHYLNNPRATEILLQPKPDDIHTANARRLTDALGREIDREWGAKTSWYAWLYGAGKAKLGTIVKGPASDGEIVIDTFFRNVPGLKELINGIQYEFKSNAGRLRTIDGGYVICPSLSAALNYKIQSAGTIVMKLAAILLDQELKAKGIWFRKVGDIHDEGQIEGLEKDVYVDEKGNKRHPIGDMAVACIGRAGRELNFRVELTGDYRVGHTWEETH